VCFLTETNIYHRLSLAENNLCEWHCNYAGAPIAYRGGLFTFLEIVMAGAFAINTRSTMTLTWIAFWLLVVGGLNWLLVGVVRFDLVAAIFGVDSAVSRLVYVLVGISAVYCAVTIPALRKPARIV
jgi:uncharacterized membrane protein YuzA (DUF378 family)